MTHILKLLVDLCGGAVPNCFPHLPVGGPDAPPVASIDNFLGESMVRLEILGES